MGMEIVPTIEMMLKKKSELRKTVGLAWVPHTASIREGINVAKAHNAGSVCVLDENKKLVRLVTDRDFRDAWLKGVNLDDPITSIGTPGDKVRWVELSMSVYDCMKIFGHDMGHAPYGKDGIPEGIVTKGDLLFGLHSDSLKVSMQMEGWMG